MRRALCRHRTARVRQPDPVEGRGDGGPGADVRAVAGGQVADRLHLPNPLTAAARAPEPDLPGTEHQLPARARHMLAAAWSEPQHPAQVDHEGERLREFRGRPHVHPGGELARRPHPLTTRAATRHRLPQFRRPHVPVRPPEALLDLRRGTPLTPPNPPVRHLDGRSAQPELS
ncbi:hypothetical protein [Kitasatospora sp. NPDC058190]|uniref:hypothetical protein n=1 Tax=Kitasatospora sp. NPDC058190 TaxID=3346371 RepID=UPI0036DBA3FA